MLALPVTLIHNVITEAKGAEEKQTVMKMLDTIFNFNGAEYVVNRIEAVDENLTALISSMNNSGKDPAFYFASKVLKSGKKSAQGGMVVRFAKTGNFLKVL